MTSPLPYLNKNLRSGVSNKSMFGKPLTLGRESGFDQLPPGELPDVSLLKLICTVKETENGAQSGKCFSPTSEFRVPKTSCRFQRRSRKTKKKTFSFQAHLIASSYRNRQLNLRKLAEHRREPRNQERRRSESYQKPAQFQLEPS